MAASGIVLIAVPPACNLTGALDLQASPSVRQAKRTARFSLVKETRCILEQILGISRWIWQSAVSINSPRGCSLVCDEISANHEQSGCNDAHPAVAPPLELHGADMCLPYHRSQSNIQARDGADASAQDSQSRADNTSSTTESCGMTKFRTISPRPGSYDDGKKDDDDKGDGQKKHPTEAANSTAPLRRLACPFWKNNPGQYPQCFRLTLKHIRYVKQHLFRSHQQPIHCPTCGKIFADSSTRDDHIRERSCPTPTSTVVVDGITESQGHKLRRAASRRQSEREQWSAIWTILFPGIPQPASPYVTPVSDGGVDMVWAYWQRNRKSLIREAMGPSAARATQDGSQLFEAENAATALSQRIVDILLYRVCADSEREFAEDVAVDAMSILGDSDVEGPTRYIEAGALRSERELFEKPFQPEGARNTYLNGRFNIDTFSQARRVEAGTAAPIPSNSSPESFVQRAMSLPMDNSDFNFNTPLEMNPKLSSDQRMSSSEARNTEGTVVKTEDNVNPGFNSATALDAHGIVKQSETGASSGQLATYLEATLGSSMSGEAFDIDAFLDGLDGLDGQTTIASLNYAIEGGLDSVASTSDQ